MSLSNGRNVLQQSILSVAVGQGTYEKIDHKHHIDIDNRFNKLEFMKMGSPSPKLVNPTVSNQRRSTGSLRKTYDFVLKQPNHCNNQCNALTYN